MFTGIIKGIGVIERVESRGGGRRLSIKSTLSKERGIGDSLAVDGVCLTVSGKSGDLLHFDLIKETLDTTTLGLVKNRDIVNLEPPLELGEAISGHLVSGHIDERGSIKKMTRSGRDAVRLTIGVSEMGRPFLVQKGSVAVDGISLTVSGIGRDFFVVDIIPHTLNATTLNAKRAGEKVNIEFDMIAKYVLSKANAPAIDENLLRENGFI